MRVSAKGAAVQGLRLIWYRMRWLLAMTALLFLCSGGVAEAKSWQIEAMDVLLDVQKDGSVLVEETVTFRFEGPFSYVARVIPTRNLESLSDIQVLKDGKPLPQGSGVGTFEVLKEEGDRVIKVNFALQDTTATWVFRYRAIGGILYFDEGDELRWYVFDADTPVPMGSVRTTVRLPEPVPQEKLTVAVNTGASVERDYSVPAPGTVVFRTGEVPPFTNFWVVVGFPKGVVKYTWTLRRVLAAVVPRAGFALPIFFFLGMLLLWRRRGRDEPSAVYAKYITEPPSDLPPALAGALIDEEANVNEIVATIVDLARRRYIDIVEQRPKGLFSKNEVVFHKLRSFDDLAGFEEKVASALFGRDKTTVSTSELKNRFYSHVQPICNAIYSEVTRRGFFHGNPQKVRNKWRGYAGLVAAPLSLISCLLIWNDIAGWGFWVAGSIVSVVIVFLFASHMPQRTAKGAQETRKWEAFRNYLRDLGRFQDVASAKETFERYLPYAIAFKVEKDWVRRFQDVEVPAPVWYHPVYLPSYSGPSGSGLSLDSISDSLFAGLTNISNVLTSAPSSTGSGRGAFGGSFGGGFSGGGGGGGFRAG